MLDCERASCRDGSRETGLEVWSESDEEARVMERKDENGNRLREIGSGSEVIYIVFESYLHMNALLAILFTPPQASYDGVSPRYAQASQCYTKFSLPDRRVHHPQIASLALPAPLTAGGVIST